jgi:predicted TIM-barrel fold metal-dependent hydrolase
MKQEVIDIHIHFGAPDHPESGCYWSREFEKGLAFFAVRLVTRSLFRKMDLDHIQKHMLGVINGAKYVQKGVLLAMDQVYDEDGNVCRQRTHLRVPNSYLAGLARENERILFGASVHPYRLDWEDELEYCLAHKAVLCKWIPSSLQVDPAHPRCLAFYKKLAEHKLPLLCHVGSERAIPPYDKSSQMLNRPGLLRNALDAGVTVIMAHAALPLPPPLENDVAFQELIALFREAEIKNWKLYTDLSAINLGPRGSYIDRIKKDIPAQRLILGSDYPIPILDISQEPHLSLGQRLKHFLQTIFVRNPLDKNYLLIKNMQFDEAVFYNAAGILRLA